MATHLLIPDAELNQIVTDLLFFLIAQFVQHCKVDSEYLRSVFFALQFTFVARNSERFSFTLLSSSSHYFTVILSSFSISWFTLDIEICCLISWAIAIRNINMMNLLLTNQIDKFQIFNLDQWRARFFLVEIIQTINFIFFRNNSRHR